MKQNDNPSVHGQVVALFQSGTPCGECNECLSKAVSRVFRANNPTPDECRHLWSVLSTCVNKNGWEATRIEFEAMASRHFGKYAKPMVVETVRMLMSNLSIAEAA